jgi:hypothetical protein
MNNVNIDHYIGVYDNVFDEEYCNRVIDRFESINKTGAFSSDGTEQFKEGSLGRRDTSVFFERNAQDVSNEIQQAVMSCFEEYKKTYVGLNDIPLVSWCCKVQRTGHSGGYHVWHNEHGGDIGAMRRAAVWILYLTSHEGSGETEFLQQGVRVEPRAGRVVIWPASFTHPHRGNPVYNETKYIATGWFEHYYDIVKA